jgi:hypothetical protein
VAAYSGVCNEGVIIRISKVIVRCYLNIAFDYFYIISFWKLLDIFTLTLSID